MRTVFGPVPDMHGNEEAAEVLGPDRGLDLIESTKIGAGNPLPSICLVSTLSL
jgi:hypothetical protein